MIGIGFFSQFEHVFGEKINFFQFNESFHFGRQYKVKMLRSSFFLNFNLTFKRKKNSWAPILFYSFRFYPAMNPRVNSKTFVRSKIYFGQLKEKYHLGRQNVYFVLVSCQDYLPGEDGFGDALLFKYRIILF